MTQDYIYTTAEEAIRYGDEDDARGDTTSAQTMYLLAIAKALVDIRDELRRMNHD